MTFGTITSFQILSSGNSSSNLVYAVEVNGTTLSVDPKTGNVTWFVNSTDFRLKYVVTDSNNNSASMSPSVTLCNCRNGGTCNPAVANPLFETTNNLLTYGDCTCKSGFKGAFCQTQVSYCSQDPCFEGVNCTDNYTTESADCDPCPAGYIGDGRKCYGIVLFIFLDVLSICRSIRMRGLTRLFKTTGFWNTLNVKMRENEGLESNSIMLLSTFYIFRPTNYAIGSCL